MIVEYKDMLHVGGGGEKGGWKEAEGAGERGIWWGGSYGILGFSPKIDF